MDEEEKTEAPAEPTAEEEALAAVAQATNPGTVDANNFRLSNGIVLRFKQVSPVALRRAVQGIREPEVPKVYNADDNRHYDNPDDPDYQLALDRCHMARILADQKLRFVLGVELVSVPEGLDGPDGEGWIEDCRVAGVEPNLATARTRFVEWLELYALANPFDRGAAVSMAYTLSGITEQEVSDALAHFRRKTKRAANPAAPAEATADNGHRVPGGNPGAGARAGGTGER